MKRVLAILFLTIFTTASISLAARLSGRVVDIVTKQPLEAVNVSLSGSDLGAATNEQGEFELEVAAGRITLVAQRIGYQKEVLPNIKLTADRQLLIEMTSSVIEMKQVVVTANRTRSLVRDVPEFVSLISSDDFEKSNPMTVGEILQSNNLAYINQYGSLGATESISLRGSSSTQVLVLWDGQRINSPLSGGFDLGTIPVESIERIEAVHGSYSALYGADAIGGVINMITRRPAEGPGLHAAIHSTVGSYGLQNHVINLSQNAGQFSYFVTANRGESDGDFSYNPYEIGLKDKSENIRRQNASYSVRSYFAKVNGELSPATRISALVEWSKFERGVPGSLSFPTEKGYQEDKGFRSHFDLESDPGENLNLKLGGYYHKHELFYKDENPWFPVKSQNNSEAYGANAQGTVKFGGQKILLGGSYLYEAGNGSNVGLPKRENVGLFAQGQFKTAPLNNPLYSVALLPSIRYDYYSDFENGVNPRVGLLLSKAGRSGYGLRASWGKSFHVPTFNDLYWIGDAYTEGNPDLKPEQASTFDYGFRFHAPFLGGIELDAGAFHKQAEELIQWAGDFETSKWKPQNISSARVVGQEVRIALPHLLKYFSTELNYTRQKATNSSGTPGLDGKYLIYRPSHKASVVTTLQIGGASFSLTATKIGERYADEANSKKLDPVLLLDANVGMKAGFLGYKIDLVLSLKNITDEKYQMVYDYPMPGRLWRVKLGFGI